jgi:hypothetical protein
MQANQYEIALSIFERIRAAFPALAMNLDLHPKQVDLAMEIPAQPGLLFDLHLNLQNLDELHLGASALWVEWFPCTNSKRVEEYFDAVSGLLSGQFRILEHRRGERAVKEMLQRLKPGGWKTIATWSVLLFVPWPQKTLEVVQNLTSIKPFSQLEDPPA